MTEAEALKRFIPILGRISTPHDRAVITRNIQERIAGTQTCLMGISHQHAGALAWPNDPVRAKQFEDTLNAAVDGGEFVSVLHRADRRHFQIEELCAWPDCPKVDTDSPLIFWLGDAFTEAPDIAPEQDTETPAPDELDYSLLATPEYLIDAYGKWGLKIEWFKDLNSRKWLLDARRKKGQGQRGQVIEPLFCPYAVMTGFIEDVRKENRVRPNDAWRTLEHKFPRVYAAFEDYDPRQRTGD